jgi:histidine triad (HIT) family protein
MADATDNPACVFCGIIAGTEPATIVREWPDALAFVPLGPVIPDGGHILVVPRQYVADAVEDPAVTAATMARAAELAAAHEASNILTSVGRAATQSIFHLHVHVIRRAVGDQLMVPWGTTGNPHDPHSCKRSEKAEAEVERLRAAVANEHSRLSQDFEHEAALNGAVRECEYWKTRAKMNAAALRTAGLDVPEWPQQTHE